MSGGFGGGGYGGGGGGGYGDGGGGFGGGRGGGGGESETMQVESRNVGRIIGRGGSKIRELQDDSGAKIQVAREEGENGMKSVEISGSYDAVQHAKQMITECLNADFGGGRGGGGGGYGGDSGGPTETIYVDSSEVGRIIGRGGSTIREMQDGSGCRIKVSREGGANGLSSVDLSGQKGSIEDAKQRIRDCGVEIVDR